MSYIGAQIENRISPAFIKEDFTGNGSDTVFTLTNEVPGGAAQMITLSHQINNVNDAISALSGLTGAIASAAGGKIEVRV